MVEKLSSVKIISAVSLATSVPEPIAIPISAFFSAGASFTPSPVIATVSPVLREKSLACLITSNCLFRGKLLNS
ncbi:unnamed protein product [Pneumocystis jirovecii]|uniref:Uncharacterized protein n=1 Tax=Pneumocystis jirovecii TaxID=42068 RepID=L0PAQ2_PNEJI|nr:unnamed protein product [Pneumocystis jirovecii]